MHDREDIFDEVRACVAMHNMMLEVRVSEDQEENSSFYEVAEHNPRSKLSIVPNVKLWKRMHTLLIMSNLPTWIMT